MELQEAYLEASTRLFFANGFAATSYEGVARESGVAKISIYRRYRTKELLLDAVIHRVTQQLRDSAVNRTVPVDATCRDQLLHLIEDICVNFTRPRFVELQRLSIAEAKRFPQLAAHCSAENERLLEPLVLWLAFAPKNGLAELSSPKLTAIHIAHLAMGGLQMLFVQPLDSPKEIRRWAESAVDLVVNGLRADVGCTRTTPAKTLVSRQP